MILAVTGASGFLGRALVRAASGQGLTVRVLRRPGAQHPELSAVTSVVGTLADPQAAVNLLEGADVLVHLAAVGVQSRDRAWDNCLAVNTVQGQRWLEAARTCGVQSAVVVGTALEYRGHGELPGQLVPSGQRPLCTEDASLETRSAYGATKAAGGVVMRAWARETGFPVWYLRLASLYGAGDDAAKLLPAALRSARSMMPFTMTPGQQVRDWLHVDDATRAVLAAATTRPDGVSTVNVGTGEGLALHEVVLQLARCAGVHDPAFIDTSLKYRSGEPHHLVLDVALARQMLSFSPRVSLHDGLAALAASAVDL